MIIFMFRFNYRHSMKKQVIMFFIFILAPLSGQTQQMELNPDQMQQLMQQAQQMQACMSRIDQQAMAAMTEKAQAVEAKINSLCKANKRGEALNIAIEFGRTMADDENIKMARECGEMARAIMPEIKFPTSEADAKKHHICDAY